MPGQALLKATLLKETYVPLVDLNGAEKNHVVVRVLPSRLSLMERRFLDQIAPKVFPVREQFNELRHAARLQKAGFQVQDVINVYERLLAAGATDSEGYAATIANVDEDFPFSQVELHQLIYTPKQNADDVDCDRTEQPAPKSPPVCTPKDKLTNYRNSILENVMFQLEEKWRETSLDDTEHMSGSQNAAETTEADPGCTPLATGGTDEGRSAQEDNCDMPTSAWSSEGANRDPKASPTFHHSGSLHSGSLEIAFNIPVARGSPEGSVSAVLTSASWRCYLGCYSDSPSGTVSRGRSAATPTASMIITGSPAMGSADTKRRESVVAAVVRPTVNIIEGKANVGESQWETSNSHMSPPHESKNSLRKLLVSSDPLISADESQASTQDFASPVNSTDEYDEVKGERSLMSLWRRSRLDNEGEGRAEQSNGNQSDERDQHFADVEKSGSDGLRVGPKRVSPSRLSQSNSSTKSHGEARNLSEMSGRKSQSTKEPAVLSDATPDFSNGRRANGENSSARVHGDSKRRSIQSPVRSPIRSPSGRSLPSFLESLSMTETGEAKKDSNNSSRRGGVQNKIPNSPSRSHGDSLHRSPSRAAPTFLRSLSMTETGVFAARMKPDFPSRKADPGVPSGVPSSSDESLRGSRHRPLERFSKFFRRSQSMKETTLPTASASKTIETIQGMPEGRSASRTTRLQPVVDSPPSRKASKQSRDDKGPTDSLGELVHDNSSKASSSTLVTCRNNAQPSVKLSPKHCRPRLRTLIDDARDQEFEQEIDDFFAKTTSTCSVIATLKRMIGCSPYRKGQFRMKRVSSPRLDGVDPVNNSTKGRVRKSTDAQISPKRSVHKCGTLIKRKSGRSPGRSSPGRVFPGRSSPGRLSPGRSSPGRLSPGRSSPGRSSPGRLSPGRSSPGRLFPGRSSPGRLSPGRSSPGRLSPGRSSPGRLSPGRSSPGRSPGRASPGRSSPGRSPQSSPNRSILSPNRKADRGRHARKAVKPVDDIMLRRSPNRSMCDELAGLEEVSTDNIHPGSLSKTSPGRNQTGMEKVHPTPGHRQLRSRSTATRFLREYMERQEEVVQS